MSHVLKSGYQPFCSLTTGAQEEDALLSDKELLPTPSEADHVSVFADEDASPRGSLCGGGIGIEKRPHNSLILDGIGDSSVPFELTSGTHESEAERRTASAPRVMTSWASIAGLFVATHQT